MSRLFGKTTVSYKTTGSNTSRFNRTRSEHRVEKPLISADKIRRLPNSKLLVSIDGQYGIKADKCYYYLSKHYNQIQAYAVDYTTDSNVPNNEPIFPTLEISNVAEVAAYGEAQKKEKKAQADKNFDKKIEKEGGLLINAIKNDIHKPNDDI